MRWRRVNFYILSIVCLSIALLGLLLLDGYSQIQKEVRKSDTVALNVPAVLILGDIETHGWDAALSKLNPSQVKLMNGFLVQMLSHLRAAGLNAVGIGVIDIHNQTITRYQLPQVPSLLVHIPWGSLHAGATSIVNETTSNTLKMEISFLPIGAGKRLTGALYLIFPSDTLGGDLGNLLTLQITIGFMVILLTLCTVFAIERVIKFTRKEPSQVASWVQALVMDPFATPPTALQVLDPLTRTILDMRTRVYLQEALLKAVITSAPLAIIHLSLNYTVQMMNDTMCTITGLSQSQVQDQPIRYFMRDLGIPQRILVQDSFRRLHSSESVRNVELEFYHTRSKERKFALVSIVPTVVSSGDITGYTIFAEDVTTRKQWDAYTAHNDRLSLIAEFAASTAHEIRNPLTTVRGFLQLQKKRNPVLPNARDHYQIMIDEIDRVDSLITEYLTLAKVPMNAELSPIPIADVLGELLPLVTAEANMRGVHVAISDLPKAICLGSKRELKQVFLNLMKNALDAMSAGGVLTVSGTHSDTKYTTAIADTGAGIDPGNLERIFDPFFTTKLTGSGLGLSVSKKIIEAHRGEIQVDSRPGAGTTFFVNLPVIE